MNTPPAKKKGFVAIIDDDEAARLSISQMLKLRGYGVETFDSGESALMWSGLIQTDCVITDVKMPGMDGEQFLAEVIKLQNFPPVIMITGHGDISMAVRTLKAGAYDFVEKPFDENVLLAGVQRAVEKTRLSRERMIGKSAVMLKVYEQIEFVAKSNAPVLICGETGVGKELVARAIHNESSRTQGPFVPVNAGALPETMLESELFGHAKGAFTGADSDRDGKLVTSSGGTLLLDEVETLSESSGGWPGSSVGERQSSKS
jgi:two-component system C4-dicarboxylate transport response regulator DctD